MEIAEQIKEKLKKIKLVVSDVDGVLTDGRIYLSGAEEIKIFNNKDAVRIEALVRSGVPVVWFTGRKCTAVINRSAELGVRIIFKKEIAAIGMSFVDFLKKEFGVESDEVLYIGDDWGDLYQMTQVGVAATPQNGSNENKEISHIITETKGGDGAVAELIEIIMRAQGTWETYAGQYKKEFIF